MEGVADGLPVGSSLGCVEGVSLGSGPAEGEADGSNMGGPVGGSVINDFTVIGEAVGLSVPTQYSVMLTPSTQGTLNLQPHFLPVQPQ